MKVSTLTKPGLRRCRRFAKVRLQQIGNDVFRNLNRRPLSSLLELPFYLFAQVVILPVELLAIMITEIMISSARKVVGR